MSISLLVQHINALVKADPTLAGINPGLVNYGIPSKLPAIYIDAVTLDTNNRTNMTFNLVYATNKMAVTEFDTAQAILAALQESQAIIASRLIPRAEPEANVSSWFIPCIFYASKLNP
ncbi:hypothetical protein [Sphingobium lactosutens]|jgi:hypothetical protein|uniref:hypothetical protein n=1 Tax=Sphingobium lactosutens TaxID=522773 RepID=UPI001D181F3C|nr:hypothetical protein [Sphingobium lactosutens]MCC4257003.1 hypothetical protein [Sphingobium lactosutens]